VPGILIVDDHPLIRRRVRSLLSSHSLHICGEAGDGDEAIERVKELRPDIVVLDIQMPRMNGIEAAEKIRDPPRKSFSSVVTHFLYLRAEPHVHMDLYTRARLKQSWFPR